MKMFDPTLMCNWKYSPHIFHSLSARCCREQFFTRCAALTWPKINFTCNAYAMKCIKTFSISWVAFFIKMNRDEYMVKKISWQKISKWLSDWLVSSIYLQSRNKTFISRRQTYDKNIFLSSNSKKHRKNQF